jgi:SAM-dependent methyltransferase
MERAFVFDEPHYDSLNSSREATIRQLLDSLRRRGCEFETAADVGCGVGRFASFLHAEGFRTLAIDGRPENIAEAMRRCPGVEFRIFNAEDQALQSIGKYDLVLFLGLFYHLENPFVALHNLSAMTGRLAILEGICHPSNEPILSVRDEGPTEDQGLRHVALYPSERGLIKLLYRVGFTHVYRFATLPGHPAYRKSALRKQVRTILAASFSPLPTDLLIHQGEPVELRDPWAIRNSPAALGVRARDALARVGRFAVKPWPEKRTIVHRRWSRLFPS